MYVLDKLWRGKISPSERAVEYDSEYHNLRLKLIEIEKQISSELSEDGKRCFREYEEIQNRMMGISDKDIFINAFRLGMGMILDVIGEYEGQFYPYRGE